MATNKTKPSKPKSVIKKTVAKKKTAEQILKSIKRKTNVIKQKSKSTVVVEAKPIELNAEHEARLAEWKKRDEADKVILMAWGERLATTRRKVINLNEQYRDLLYKFLQEAYAVYKEAREHELADSFFSNVRGALKSLDIKVQGNTPDASLVVRLIFGAAASNKSVSEYAKALEAAVNRGVKADKFSEWLKRETLTKVLADHRADIKELETPKDRLERARRLILKLMDTRDAVPIFTLDTTAHTAEKNIGRSYGLCVALGHANRKMDRESFYAEIRFSLIIPVTLDFEIYIVDKLARLIMPRLDEWEKDLTELNEELWADKLFENLVAGCEAEVKKNKEYWANRQQAALAEDQYEFAKQVKERKRNKK